MDTKEYFEKHKANDKHPDSLIKLIEESNQNQADIFSCGMGYILGLIEAYYLEGILCEDCVVKNLVSLSEQLSDKVMVYKEDIKQRTLDSLN